ncbi:MAG: EAL domain-containing protein [Burkholderiaceae bacterium]|nr:EAL domain-containing protein [Burkholderiaceae bacterium]
MARRLGLSVVAEGVEERNQLQQLQQIDCDAVQGYYFSRPLQRDALTAFAQNWAATPLATSAHGADAIPQQLHPHAVRFAI